MDRKSRLIRYSALFVLAGAALLLMASNGLANRFLPGKWWRTERVSQSLNLNDQQLGKLDELYLENRRNLIDIRSSLEKEKLTLEQMMEQETVNEDAIMEQFRQLDKVRSQLAVERFRFILEVRKTLDHQQFQKLHSIFMDFREKRRAEFMRERMTERSMDDESGEHEMGGPPGPGPNDY